MHPDRGLHLFDRKARPFDPTGVFKILQKDKHHRSSTYNNAPMPNMNRLTWSGVALHAGNLPGYPASHGCVRLPMEFSERLFGITRTGMTVVIADNKSYPSEVAHPGLVLGDYARHEFGRVDAAVKKKPVQRGSRRRAKIHQPCGERQGQTLSVFEDDQLVAQGK